MANIEENVMRYCACCVDTDEIYYFGLGSSPEEALDEFIAGGDFETQCADFGAEEDEDVNVYIYTIINPEDSDWPEEEIDPEWKFCLSEKVKDMTVKAPKPLDI